MTAPAGGDRGTRLFLWAVTIFLFLASLRFVGAYSDQVPLGDDYNLVPVVSGHQSLSLGWLWTLDYGGREPLTKITLVAMAKLSGADFRVPRFASVVLLAMASLLMMAVARRIRGRAAWTDAFFPLLFLGFAQSRPLLQAHYYMYALNLFPILVILAAVACRALPHPAVSVVAGVCACLLPYFYATGAIIAPAMALWLAIAGRAMRASGLASERRAGTATVALAIACLVLTGLGFVGFALPPDNGPPPGFGPVLKMAGQFLSLSIGQFGRDGWPFSLVAVLALTVAIMLWLGARWKSVPDDRIRTGGLAFFLGSMLAVSLSVGWGRSYHGYVGDGTGFGFTDRYTTIAAPLLCAAYLASAIGERSRLGCVVPILLCVTMALLLPYNARDGIGKAQTIVSWERALKDDLGRGMDIRQIAARHWPNFHRSEPTFARYLEMMRKAGIGPFREARK
jgi:hypothetical protein